MPVRPPNAYPAGTKLTVGSHEVEIIDFIGAGGFAHVYTVHANPPIPNQAVTCLKRVQVPDKAYLNLLRAEVDAMQRLKGSSNIVQYFDSHAERMQSRESSTLASTTPSESDLNPLTNSSSGQYEVFLLMEYCERGGLIDFMNTRLRDQLREHEILKIMYDITLGLSHMHYLRPPLLHRDLKIENVLISSDGVFKLCDFGSVSPVLRPPKTPQELKILEDDVQHHTTVQYRPPEMIDVRMGYPIDEKSDIWALGVFLYKLCYYTTPFERPNQTLEQFSQLILAGSFAIPPRPAYSDRLRNMICVLLQPNPRMRPNVFQVMQEICSMRHIDVPIADIYRNPVVALPPATMVPNTASHPGVGSVMAPLNNQQLNSQQLNSQPLNTQPLNTQPLNNQQFVPGVPHPGAPNHHPATPGQIAIPGVLLTSPAVPPHSPERSVSPLDDLNSRFPSLEELDRLGPAVSKPAANLPEERLLNKVPKQEAPSSNQYPRKPLPLKTKPQEAGNLVDFSEDDSLASPAPAVSAEAANLQKILHGISDRSSTVIMDKPAESSSLSSVDFLRTLRSSEAPVAGPHHKSHHKSHLKSHLKSASRSSGLFAPKIGRSKYVDAGDEDDFTMDDSAEEEYDASRSYDQDEKEPYSFDDEVSDLSSENELPVSRSSFDEKKAVKPPLVAKPLKPTGLKNDAGLIKPAKPISAKPIKPAPFSRSVPDLDPVQLGSGSSSANANGVNTSTSPGTSTASNVSNASTASNATNTGNTGKPVVRASKPPCAFPTAAPSKPVVLGSSKPSVPKTKPDLPCSPPTAPSAGLPNRLTKARPNSMVQTFASPRAGELTAFKPSNSIQQRVHMFLNSQDRQHPPRKTASGYGRFTEPSDFSEPETELSNRETESSGVMRRRSLGVLATRKPKI